MKNICIALLLGILAMSCAPKPAQDENPPAEGFDLVNSDPGAISLADSIMKAMGGRKNWDNTRFISWTFFGRRNLIWDKQAGRVRIDNLRDTSTFLVNVNTMEGRFQKKGAELQEPDSLKKMLARAKSMWINDSYWLVMPFKLKDSGVTLKSLGTDTLKGGEYAILQLTFANVGDTPQNKYKLYVDDKANLIRYWSYFSDAAQDTANFTRPWDNYQKYGKILLSGDRSDKGGPSNVKVFDTLPDSVFTKF
jgi:hypothetical protein